MSDYEDEPRVDDEDDGAVEMPPISIDVQPEDPREPGRESPDPID